MKNLRLVRTIILAGSLLLQLNTFCPHARGAAGDVDLSFDPGSGVNGPVNAVAVQPDGKVLIGGDFTIVRGLARRGVARLHADGSGDSSFELVGVNIFNVRAIVLQPDGKMLLGHGGGVVRLHANGVFDTNYAYYSSSFYDPSVRSMVLQADGKALIGGNLHIYTENVVGGWNIGIARLHADGTLDTNFNSGYFSELGWDTRVESIAVQADGKVIVVGALATQNGTNVNYGIARLHADGTLDGSFNPGTGANLHSDVRSVLVQPDGKILLGGNFGWINGTNRLGIARLNADGSLENSFNVSITNNLNVYSMILQPDGKVLVSGDGSHLNVPRGQLKRFNADGTLDGNFTSVYSSFGISLALQTDGKVLVGTARLNADGTLDESFDAGLGTGVGGSPSSIALQPDGKMLIGGLYTFLNGTNRYGSVRLHADGSMDSTFISGSFNPNLTAMIPDCPPGADCSPEVIPITLSVQPDGKVLVGGRVYSLECYNVEGGSCYQYGRYFLTRLNADGSPDASFEPVIGDKKEFNPDRVLALAVQPDGKIIMSGFFGSVKGTNRNGIARLNPNGSLDSAFNVVNTSSLNVYSVVLQSDGKVLIGGDFSFDNFTDRNRIARLNADGSLDGSFNPGTGPNATVQLIALQPDGKTLIGGSFTIVNGTNRNRIARLHADGSLDSSFDPGPGVNGGTSTSIASLALQSDGNILIGGDFTTVNGVLRPRVARLYGDAVTPSLNITRLNALMIVSWPASAVGYQIEESTNLSVAHSWSPVAQPAVTNAGQITVSVPAAPGSKFFRLKSQ